MDHLLLYSVCYLSMRKKGTKISDIYTNILPDINMYESQMHSTLEWRICEPGVSHAYWTQKNLLQILFQSCVL